MGRPMLRLLFYVVAFAAGVYGLFFVQLDGKPVVHHLQDIWNSPTVQQKVKLVENSVHSPPAHRPVSTAASSRPEPRPPHARPPDKSPPREDTSEHDRKALNALVEHVQKSP